MKNRLTVSTAVFYSFFLALLFLFVKGYTFNSWDQAEVLPLVYQLLDSSLYPNDFFMQEYNKVFTIRHIFVYFVFALSYFSSVACVCFLLTLLSLFFSIFYFIKITRHFTDNIYASLISPLFTFIIFLNFTVGGNQIQSNSLIPGTIASAFAIAGLANFLEKKTTLSFLLLGIGTWFQPLITLQIVIILFILQFFEQEKKNIRNIFLSVFVYFVSAAPMLLPVIYRQFFLQTEYNNELYYEILYRFRNHLHYLPSLFPAEDYLKFSLLIIAGFFALRFSSIHNSKFIFRFSALIISGLFVYWLLLEIAAVRVIGKLQWFKTTVWINAFACIGLSTLVGKYAEIILKQQHKKLLAPLSLAGSVILLAILLNSKLLPHEKLQNRYLIGNYKKTDLTLLHEWMEKNLPKNAIVLCSPENTTMICEAKRSQAVIYQSIIHEPFYMLPWYQRFMEIYGVSLENANRNDIRKQADELYQKRNYKGAKYKIDYRIDNIKTCTYLPELGKTIHQNGDWILTEFAVK